MPRASHREANKKHTAQCGVFFCSMSLLKWRPLGDSNPSYLDENQMS